MNIFVLDTDINKCVKYHNNKHVVKMILESAQIISTVSRNYGLDIGYKETHKNHPCTKWAANSFDNFMWLNDFVHHLHEEWNYRFSHDKIHKSIIVVDEIMKNVSEIKSRFPETGITKFAMAMPEEYRSDDIIKSYRDYYIGEKRHLADWGKRGQPKWWI